VKFQDMKTNFASPSSHAISSIFYQPSYNYFVSVLSSVTAYGKSPTVHNIATPMRDISDQVKKKYPPLLFTFKEAK